MAEQKAKLNYLKIAPRKVRLMANLIKGLSVNEAEAQLLSLPNRSTGPLLKLLRSAVANAKNNNSGLNPDHLFVKSIIVNEGPMLKRFLPRARGMATPIHKKSSHVSIILDENKDLKSKFNIVVKKKEPKEDKATEKKSTPASTPKPSMEREKVDKREGKDKGFFKKMFRRKSV